jgi:hypothetical protein
MAMALAICIPNRSAVGSIAGYQLLRAWRRRVFLHVVGTSSAAVRQQLDSDGKLDLTLLLIFII